LEEYGDKEAFVTDAYRERQKELEEAGGVEDEEKEEGQSDMSVFYRQVLDSTDTSGMAVEILAEKIATTTKEDTVEEARIQLEIASGLIELTLISKVVYK
jgi:hypothetical protein